MKRLCMLALLLVLACTPVYQSSIPNFPVYLELDLTFEDKDLIPLQSSKVYTSKNLKKNIEKAGFGGVLLYHALNDGYYAFDLACPNEANSKIIVEVESDNLHARCPNCQSKYDLSYGNANPVSGQSKETLKRYTVTMSGTRVYVRN